jgi:GNAT superfamily N-acetyltransferase
MIFLARVQAYLRAAARLHAEVIEVPGFTIFVSPADATPGESFAMPDSPAAATVGSLREVTSTLLSRQRIPAISAIEGYAPGLSDALEGAGYRESARKAIMVYEGAPAQTPPRSARLGIQMLDARASLAAIRENLAINIAGFESDEPPPTEDDARAFARLLTRARAFTVTLRGKPVAAALMEAPVDGVTELVGVATLPAYRRRGIAAVLVAHMARQAQALGVEVVFLRPISEASARIYARAGFSPRGDVVTWVRETPA